MSVPAAGAIADEPPSAFWTFSLAVYRRPGVPDACLRLQDEHGADVNLVLWALWLGTRGRALDPADLAAARARVAPWCAEVVKPLRRLRRLLKTPPEGFTTPGTERLRDRLKAVELESERLQQEALAAVATADPPGRAAEASRTLLVANIGAYAQTLGTDFPADAVAPLLAAAAEAPTDGSPA